jgi:SAM-dependent methyltransferase
MSRVHPTAQGFDRAARDYDAGRPGYPAASVAIVADTLALGPGRRVADVAAGTGKLTRELVATGADVVAVEPSAPMREQLRRAVPDGSLEVIDGTAEALPLPDASVDAMTVAQAFHWFDGDAALAEAHRVLRPGGRYAVVFNRRDVATPVQGTLDELLAPYRGDTPSWATHDWDAPLAATERFRPVATHAEPWVQHLDLEGLVARVASVSFVARLDEAARGRVLAAVRDLHARSRSDDAGRVALHYVTEVRVLERRST